MEEEVIHISVQTQDKPQVTRETSKSGHEGSLQKHLRLLRFCIPVPSLSCSPSRTLAKQIKQFTVARQTRRTRDARPQTGNVITLLPSAPLLFVLLFLFFLQVTFFVDCAYIFHKMGVSNPVKYVLGLSLFTKRPDQRSPAAAAVWKGKAIDHHGQQQHHHHHHQEIRWGGAVQGPDDDEEFVAAAVHMAVSESDGSRCSGSSSRNSSDSSGSNSSSSNSIRNPHKRHYGVVRVVSWASLVGERCRWTIRQERELAIAEHELARCQKAWSSEQELWLTQIQALHEEKEAHEEFLHHRAKQQDEEQQHFRKSWNRRRAHEEPSQHPTPPHPQPPQRMASTHRANSKLRRGIRRMGS